MINSVSDVVELKVGQTLVSQKIRINDQIIRYRPIGLLPKHSYEIRISFPATNPTYIHLWMESRNSTTNSNTHNHRSRKLLNAEKITLVTDATGKIILDTGHHEKEVDVLFKATHWALSRDGRHGGQKILLFDIILEENVLGIPVSGLPLVFTAIILAIVCAALLPWWIRKAVPWMQRWLATGETRKDRSR